MTVARLVYFLLPSHKGCGISARWMAKGFVAADILSFAIQAVGGSMIADQQDREKASTGQKVYMVGIGVQLVFVLAFAAITCVFYRDLEEAIRKGELRRNNNWNRPVIWTVFAVLLLIVVSWHFDGRLARYILANAALLDSHRLPICRVWRRCIILEFNPLQRVIPTVP